jgi:hypothetical protein
MQKQLIVIFDLFDNCIEIKFDWHGIKRHSHTHMSAPVNPNAIVICTSLLDTFFACIDSVCVCVF